MSKKNKKKLENKIQQRNIGSGFTDMDLIQQMSFCNDCANGFSMPESVKKLDNLDWLLKNLPTLPYVENQYINFLFSNGLTTGNEEEDKRLSNFLYSLNIKGVTNYNVIQEAVIKAKEEGRCGIRWLSEEDGIVLVPKNRYVSLMKDDSEYKGIKRTVFYAVSADEDKSIDWDTNVEIDETEFKENGRLISKDETIILCTPDEFINLRNDTSTEEGESVLSRDLQRLQLLASVYVRLNYDIEYDGPGRLIFWMKDGFSNGSGVDVSAGEILNETTASKEERARNAQRELAELANQIKNSTSDNVVLASSMFKDLDHLPRVTKATEFLDYLTLKEGSILAQCFGITPELIGLGDVSGNVSMEKIIDNGMLNNIVPQREQIATQFSPMLSKQLGFTKIYFDKYEMKQNLDKSAEVYKYALSASQFASMQTVEGDKMAQLIMIAIAQQLGIDENELDLHETMTRYEQNTDENTENDTTEQENSEKT